MAKRPKEIRIRLSDNIVDKAIGEYLMNIKQRDGGTYSDHVKSAIVNQIYEGDRNTFSNLVGNLHTLYNAVYGNGGA